MASLSTWYSNQYGVWRRTRGLHMPRFTTQDNPNVPVTGQQPVASAAAGDASKTKPETLFGPALGAVSPAPDWTNIKSSTKDVADELTPDIVRSWIAKSKDPSQPTTTLQALVNVKRPTLRLSPLTDDPGHHAIEFEYDADAPKCSISVHVFPPATPNTPLLVYQHISDGGFGKTLKLEDDAVLELAKYEFVAGQTPQAAELKPEPSSSAPADTAPVDESAANGPKKRFSAFHFRKRPSGTGSRNASGAVTAGPALQVVDVDATVPSQDVKKDDDGVRVMIRIEALDEHEHSLASINTQTTYLHIVRLGTKPEGQETEQDTRPWVVKVVKREATIGFHTFHLHEIYGLTSTSSSGSAPAPPEPTYPPTATNAANATYDFAGQECVLCLSSPREVVLLPCRHLVACKECADNMVEFGAGGTLHQATDDAAADTTQPEQTATTSAAGDATVTPAVAPVTTPAPRRKRKPKGWFCPVCRQPYTSLLRITTTPPDLKPVRDSEDGTEAGEPGHPLAEADNDTAVPAVALEQRPSFLRSISRAFNGSAPSAPAPAAAEVPNHVA
ncbi:hypothetical protein AURDEDRAFT_111846 [Auricularia subglabra TFB-10046 SS5]|nr:hypothetical protein AURDEDRAFT_111846 [Auricularia subglabra TFB-10046 SS5]